MTRVLPEIEKALFFMEETQEPQRFEVNGVRFEVMLGEVEPSEDGFYYITGKKGAYRLCGVHPDLYHSRSDLCEGSLYNGDGTKERVRGILIKNPPVYKVRCLDKPYNAQYLGYSMSSMDVEWYKYRAGVPYPIDYGARPSKKGYGKNQRNK